LRTIAQYCCRQMHVKLLSDFIILRVISHYRVLVMHTMYQVNKWLEWLYCEVLIYFKDS